MTSNLLIEGDLIIGEHQGACVHRKWQVKNARNAQTGAPYPVIACSGCGIAHDPRYVHQQLIGDLPESGEYQPPAEDFDAIQIIEALSVAPAKGGKRPEADVGCWQ